MVDKEEVYDTLDEEDLEDHLATIVVTSLPSDLHVVPGVNPRRRDSPTWVCRQRGANRRGSDLGGGEP